MTKPKIPRAVYPPTLRQRFWAKVQKTDGCWLWTGSVGLNGYGHMFRNGGVGAAHRISYELHVGPIFPKEMFVLHRCDNPACVNPAHLFLGTPADNMRDKVAKGRLPTPLARRSKLTESQVHEIRADPRPPHLIAKAYGVSENTAYRVKYRRSWRHV